MKPYPSNSIWTIVIPLMVMFLLTVVVSVVSYQGGVQWDQAHQSITNTVVRGQFLRNLYWQLREVDFLLHQHKTDEAKRLWNETGQIIQQVKIQQKAIAPPDSLSEFLSDDSNMNRIPDLLVANYFQFSFQDLQQALSDIQRQSQESMAWMSLIMCGLGFVLMTITGLDLIRLFKALKDSRDLNTHIQEQERRRIARDLHDEVIQELIVFKRNPSPEQVDSLVESIRRICHNLNPQMLEDLGLVAGLKMLMEEFGASTQITLTAQMDDEAALNALPQNIQLALFRVVQELLSNVRRHAKATKVQITLVYVPEESPLLRLYLSDNGQGFIPAKVEQGHLGLVGIRQRVEQLQGQLDIQSTPNGVSGTTVRIMVPLAPQARTKRVNAPQLK